jgi:hypothetical protein
MPETKDSLDFLKKMSAREPEKPPVEEQDPETLTIAEMDGRYSTLRPANKTLTRMHVILKNGKIFSFQNHYLDVRSTFEGGTFVLLFAGTKHYEVTVIGHGPKFWAVYDYCTQHRWPYLREATRDFAADGETVFTEIRIVDVTPKPGE